MAVRIGIGTGRYPFESVGEFRAWLDLCENSAIDSIWQSDRVVSKEPALEPMTLLSIVAGATSRLKFGTNAVVLPFRDPITFARQCATLDYMSEGRLLPTVAIGRGDAAEWEATGRSPKGRGARADEALEVITRLWESESANFDGEFFALKDATITPRPKQNPLPLWLGGASKAAIRRTARFGSGWLATPDTGRDGCDGRGDPRGEPTNRPTHSRRPLWRDDPLPDRQFAQPAGTFRLESPNTNTTRTNPGDWRRWRRPLVAS